MKIISRCENKGELIKFESTEILDELRKIRVYIYYMSFSSIIDLNNLENKILKHILKGNNKQITFQARNRRFKLVWILSWNKFKTRLIYRDDKLKYTLLFSKGGVLIYPNSSSHDKSLKLAIYFIRTLEMGGCLKWH